MTDVQYFFICSFLLLILTLILHFIFKKLSKKKTHLCLLPPSPPALPVIGHLHHLTPAAYKCLDNLCSKYGPLLYLRLGNFPVLLVSSASMANEIFKTHDLNFSYKAKSPFEDSVLFGNSSFFHAPYGDYWRFMKKLCVTELLGARQLERSRSVRREELVRFLRKMLQKADKHEVVDVCKEIMTLTNNTTCRMVMSTRCSGEDNEADRCIELVRESFELVAKMAAANFLGPLRKLAVRCFRKQALDVPRRFEELLEKLLEEHEDRRRNGGELEDKDLMDILLEVYHDKNAEIKISRIQMKSFLLDLFFGGTGTSAHAMQWVMAELINHPDVFKKLREEIECVVGRNRLVGESDIPSLHYLQAVVKETLRLYPPSTVITRQSLEDCKIGGFHIPKETLVAINPYSIMRDPKIWENPDEFCPDRFLVSSDEEADNKMGTKEQEFSCFITFGGGRRMCPGSNLALSLISATVAAMVQCFDWQVGGDEEMVKVNMEATDGVTMSLVHPIFCVPVVHFNPFDICDN